MSWKYTPFVDIPPCKLHLRQHNSQVASRLSLLKFEALGPARTTKAPLEQLDPPLSPSLGTRIPNFLETRAPPTLGRHTTMATYIDSSYSLVHQDNLSDVPSMSELRTQLEKGTDDSKCETMKRILTIMLNGDPMPQLLMHIIRFVMPSKDKKLKKLLYFYYEICPKLDAAGKLKQEMILVW